MLLGILLGIAALIVLFVVIVSLRSGDFRISRFATMAAPQEDIFGQVNTLRNWEAWSPFEKLDPNMKRTYEGPPSGVGASQYWSGNSAAGEGRSTISESDPYNRIGLKLEMVRPMKATNDAEFTFVPENGQTRVTWTISGCNGFMGKAFSLFMNMDKMLGGEFEKGLADLKKVVESKSHV